MEPLKIFIQRIAKAHLKWKIKKRSFMKRIIARRVHYVDSEEVHVHAKKTLLI